MNKFFYTVICLLLIQFSAIAQTSINDYKYIVVPKQFNFQKTEGQYQLNELTKFLFNKYGYSAILEGEDFPEDLIRNRCLALRAKVDKLKGGFLKTDVQIQLIDCQGTVVMTSKEGSSRIKAYDKAYNAAIREAFETYQFYDYTYQPNSKIVSQTTKSEEVSDAEAQQAQAEIERLKNEVEALKEQQEATANKITETSKPTVEKPLTSSKVEKSTETYALYAQPTSTGYQVVDTSPKVVMLLLETPKKDVFLVKDDNAIVYKQDGVWYLSKYKGDEASVTALKIKF
ncbi:MAG: hypothetical protein GYB32_04835 [Algicola sp.]|nr:hypothetical protein [Algicola sp.]